VTGAVAQIDPTASEAGLVIENAMLIEQNAHRSAHGLARRHPGYPAE
jgi:hypothetical protein